jgi:hypothetical protein
MQLREKLISIQGGRHDSPEGWMHTVRDIAY